MRAPCIYIYAYIFRCELDYSDFLYRTSEDMTDSKDQYIFLYSKLHIQNFICPQYFSYGLAYATHEIDGISSLKLKHHTTIEYYVTTPHSNVYMSIYIRQITCTSFHPYMCLYFLHLCSYPICNQSNQPYYRTNSPNGCFPVFHFLLGREFSPPS